VGLWAPAAEFVLAPQPALAGLSGLRRNLRWDALDAAYFAGYAWWNYLSTPMLLTRDGVTVTECDTWPEAGEQWRRLQVSFPPDIHTHSRRQTFYIDAAGLIRRHDYVAHPIGGWAHAAHYCADHRRFAGLVFPTRDGCARKDPWAEPSHARFSSPSISTKSTSRHDRKHTQSYASHLPLLLRELFVAETLRALIAAAGERLARRHVPPRRSIKLIASGAIRSCSP
jgi:hypothetical protein